MTRGTSMLEDAWTRMTDFHERTPEQDERYVEWARDDLASDMGIPASRLQGLEDDPRWSKVWKRAAEIRDSHGEHTPHDPEFDRQAFEEVFG